MTSVVKVEMPDGQVIWARVGTGAGDVAASDVVKKLDVEELKSSVRAVSSAVRAATTELLPDTVTVEFGFELAVKAGKLVSVLTEVGGKATLSVSMSWSAAELPTGNA
ncbi:CU044_2847 family protein [Micromonospora sp. DSM 115977]|uniref:CU044_2847 family protein n=1 Tax=Micromonospora reichwaldensis TaxID=3075516 RepID=A0ABU2WTF6_9ACTN|nr:CU044_2847 family protein [Micromonospora sp. DSM 115977]MDT0529182.1 CU044_2847 family protein [Micromonospora sp. DSM 115977]